MAPGIRELMHQAGRTLTVSGIVEGDHVLLTPSCWVGNRGHRGQKDYADETNLIQAYHEGVHKATQLSNLNLMIQGP